MLRQGKVRRWEGICCADAGRGQLLPGISAAAARARGPAWKAGRGWATFYSPPSCPHHPLGFFVELGVWGEWPHTGHSLVLGLWLC